MHKAYSKNIFPVLILYVLLCVSTGSLYGEVEVGVTTKTDSAALLQNRVLIKGNKWKFFGYAEEKMQKVEGSEEKLHYHGGFSSPVFVCGPISFLGTLKEMKNPGNYSAGSGVYSERNGVKTDIAMSKKSFYGAVLRLPEKQVGIGGGYHVLDCRLHGGIWCNIPLGDYCGLKGSFFGSYLTKDEVSEDEWISDYPFTMPQTLLHGSTSFAVKTLPFLLSVTGCCSATKIGPLGFFLRGHADLDTRFLAASLASTYVFKDFITPEGAYPKPLFSLTGSAVLLPEYYIHLHGAYEKQYKRLTVFPQMFIPMEDTWNISVQLEFTKWEASAEWDYTQSTDGYGTIDGREAFGGGITFRFLSWLTITGACSYGYDIEKNISIRAPITLILAVAPVKITIQSTVMWEETLKTENRLRFDVTGPCWAGFLLVKANITGVPEMGPLFVQLGWSISGTL